MNGNYGVVRGISTKMKLGFVVAWKVFTLAGVVMFTFLQLMLFSQWEKHGGLLSSYI